MARKEKDLKEYVEVNWYKVIGMVIGLAIAIISVTLFVSLIR